MRGYGEGNSKEKNMILTLALLGCSTGAIATFGGQMATHDTGDSDTNTDSGTDSGTDTDTGDTDTGDTDTGDTDTGDTAEDTGTDTAEDTGTDTAEDTGIEINRACTVWGVRYNVNSYNSSGVAESWYCEGFVPNGTAAFDENASITVVVAGTDVSYTYTEADAVTWSPSYEGASTSDGCSSVIWFDDATYAANPVETGSLSVTASYPYSQDREVTMQVICDGSDLDGTAWWDEAYRETGMSVTATAYFDESADPDGI
jgi:hypothetical protein